MPIYEFQARDAEGRPQKGTREAPSDQAALTLLRSAGLTPLRLERREAVAAPRGEWGLWRLFPPGLVDVELGLQQISFMLRSGLPLLSALLTTSRQSTKTSMARVWGQVAERVQAGGSFSEALGEHRCFPALVTTMAAVGEQTGSLDEVLLRAASALERRRLLLTNLRTALIYPSLVLVMAMGTVAYMMVGLIPKLSKFLAGMGRSLPPMTRMLMDISTAVQVYWSQGLILTGTAIAGFLIFRAWPPGRRIVDGLWLRLPVAGNVLRLAGTATVARNLGSLLASGVRITAALGVVEPLIKNRVLSERLADARDRVLQGSSLAEPLSAPGAFLPMLGNMVAVGETSGALDEVLQQVAEFHEKRLEAVIRRLSAIVEPVIIVVVGGIVGFIYMSFFVAIYSIVGGR